MSVSGQTALVKHIIAQTPSASPSPRTPPPIAPGFPPGCRSVCLCHLLAIKMCPPPCMYTLTHTHAYNPRTNSDKIIVIPVTHALRLACERDGPGRAGPGAGSRIRRAHIFLISLNKCAAMEIHSFNSRHRESKATKRAFSGAGRSRRFARAATLHPLAYTYTRKRAHTSSHNMLTPGRANGRACARA